MHYTEMYLQSQIEYYKSKVERVRELHKPFTNDYGLVACEHCSFVATVFGADGYEKLVPYERCADIKALDGEQ